VSDLTGSPAALDDKFEEAPLFYITFAAITLIAGALIMIPGVSLIKILITSQVVNAILLLPLLAYMYGISKDRKLMGDYVAKRGSLTLYGSIIALVGICVLAQFWFMFNL
jgi:Mn2+/Fe2+ NRAMP family transporter